jgi:hypothetical protein
MTPPPPKSVPERITKVASRVQDLDNINSKPKLFPIPNDYYTLAILDALTIPSSERFFIRYVTNPDPIAIKTTSLTLNIASRGSVIVKPAHTPNSMLVRVDLRHYAPRPEDLVEWVGFWELLAFDPMFSLIITRDNIDFLTKILGEEGIKELIASNQAALPPNQLRKIKQTRIVMKTIKVKGKVQERNAQGKLLYWVDSGKPVMIDGEVTKQVPTEETIEVDVNSLGLLLNKKVNAIRFNAAHLNPNMAVQLQQLLGTQVPVVDHRYLKHRMLTTIKDNGVYETVFGGLYYEFRGIKKAKDVLGKDTKATDLDLFFENLGIGNIKGNLTADQLFDKLRSDQRSVMFRSQITGKPREISSFQPPSTREYSGWGAITGDIKDADIDIGDRQFANLLTPRRKAREAIFRGANGHCIFALFNDKGELQNEVPPDIANDSTIPRPHTQRLQAARGCIVCHSIFGDNGWRPMTNDIKTLLVTRNNLRNPAPPRLDIFQDFENKRVQDRFQTDVIDRLAGLFAGDFSKNIRRAREDNAEATIKTMGPWLTKEGKVAGDGTQGDIVKLSSLYLQSETYGYQYDLVTPRIALKEEGIELPNSFPVFGLEVEDEKFNPVKVFTKLHPPDKRSATIEGIIPEDPRIAALKAGLSISRQDWALVYNYALKRSLSSPYRKELIKLAQGR